MITIKILFSNFTSKSVNVYTLFLFEVIKFFSISEYKHFDGVICKVVISILELTNFTINF